MKKGEISSEAPQTNIYFLIIKENLKIPAPETILLF